MPEVVYELSLKDHFSSPMKEANTMAETLHGTMTSLLTTLGVGIGIGGIFDYLKGATEEVDKIREAQGQLQAGLISTHHAAGIGYEEMQEQAEKFAHVTDFTKAQVLDMQAQILTFPGVTEKTFGDASQAILDMSARLHKGADEVAIMVGKALQDPERGITALRRIGVNFDKEHTERIKRMVEQGHILQAQAAIMKELQTEFAGSAKAAADANPLHDYEKAMEDVKEQIGGMIVLIEKDFAPQLVELADHFKDLVEWLKQNGAQLWNLIKALGVAYGAFRVGSIAIASYKALMAGLGPASLEAAAGTEAFGAATTLALGPIGLLVAAVAALGANYYIVAEQERAADDRIRAAAERQKKVTDDRVEHEKKGIDVLVAYREKHFHEDESTAAAKAIWFEKQALNERLGQQMDILSGKGSFGALSDSKRKEVSDAIDLLNIQKTALDTYTNSPRNISKTGGKGGDNGNTISTETKGAKGNKVNNISIHIGNLVKDFKIETINMKEGSQKVKEMITQVLMSAVNNSEMLGDR